MVLYTNKHGGQNITILQQCFDLKNTMSEFLSKQYLDLFSGGSICLDYLQQKLNNQFWMGGDQEFAPISFLKDYALMPSNIFTGERFAAQN